MYLGQAAHDLLALAQVDIEHHAMSCADGLCLTCRTAPPA